jgi:hypothetical protein
LLILNFGFFLGWQKMLKKTFWSLSKWSTFSNIVEWKGLQKQRV